MGLVGGAMLATGCQQKRVGSVSYADLEPLLRPVNEAASSGVVARPVTVRVSQYGGDLMAAIQSLPAEGGVIGVDQTLYLSGTVDVPRGVELVGTVALPGNNSSGNVGVDHLQQRHILVARGVSPALRVHGAAGLQGLFLHKEGVLFGDTSAIMFADDAVHLVGEDAYVVGCFITGFVQAVYGTFIQRSRIINNRLDCLNGVWLEKVFDIARVYSNHAWPFVTVAVNTPESAWREGAAFRFSDGGDWNHLTGNFCFGYARGYWLHNVADVTAVQCGADSFPAHKNGVGFHITGQSKNIALLACQAAGQRIGFWNETAPKDKPDQMIGCSHWGNVVNVQGWD
ncbi:MAG: hypothetical protein BWK73_34510 [Thiothrix lacustris]|uniref:Right handed beta helix domain-containing protein n=1 Tax=Thiothrix lacustris TaxID=525917 RepID=A0A1Y1QGJ7_9GAMM|nr:MAG: hypothetical protein BWK73_34510 [Thiothrix lacustris]